MARVAIQTLAAEMRKAARTWGMVTGTVRTRLDSGLRAAEVLDLVPIRPLQEDEETIRSAYRTRVARVFQNLKG